MRGPYEFRSLIFKVRTFLHEVTQTSIFLPALMEKLVQKLRRKNKPSTTKTAVPLLFVGKA
jgi:hypothetical protein